MNTKMPRQGVDKACLSRGRLILKKHALAEVLRNRYDVSATKGRGNEI